MKVRENVNSIVTVLHDSKNHFLRQEQMQTEDKIIKAVELIRQADGLLITAGAGMGVDSGLPDFRGNEGLWRAYPKLGKHLISFVEIANPNAFSDNPRLAWGFYGHRLKRYRETQPHEGFMILKKMAEKRVHGAFVFTSNVDGQFQKAGFDETRIAECHGSIHHLQCTIPCSASIWESDKLTVQVDEENCQLLSNLPVCPECGGLSRPNILMFNDWGWISNRTEMQMERLNKWYRKTNRPVVLEIGAGVHVPTVRHASESFNVPIIRINPDYPEVPKSTDIGLALGALDALRLINARLASTM